MRIGELARLSGLSRDTLRFYEARGLIRADRHANGYRSYPEGTVFVLQIVRTARELGFTLAEIEADLPQLSDGGLSQERVAEILRGKIAILDERIVQLSGLRNALNERLADACPLMSPA